MHFYRITANTRWCRSRLYSLGVLPSLSLSLSLSPPVVYVVLSLRARARASHPSSFSFHLPSLPFRFSGPVNWSGTCPKKMPPISRAYLPEQILLVLFYPDSPTYEVRVTIAKSTGVSSMKREETRCMDTLFLSNFSQMTRNIGILVRSYFTRSSLDSRDSHGKISESVISRAR